jgi:NADH-ubiquinone oxidoreductase chain 5
MAAPTPVSSLVHSSTLVTAGIYILIRYNYIFVFFNLSFFSVFSLFTMVLAGVGAFLEKDFKKIVAMSTLRQLGLIIYVISIGCWMFSFVHIIIHAFFKRILFLSTGATIAQFRGGQDSRIFGGSFLIYISFLYFLVSCICLSGFPFFIGFYSKDFIINSSSFLRGVLSYYFFLFGCFFTILYSIRLLKNVYFAFLKFSVFFCFSESFIYVFSVLFLFFKGWSLGGFFYWFFIFENFYFFCYFDLLAGLLIIFLGVFFYSFLRFTYFLCVYFGSISFYLWLSSSKSSMSFIKYFFYNFDFG